MDKKIKDYICLDITEEILSNYLKNNGYKNNNLDERSYLGITWKKYLKEITTYIKFTILFLDKLRKPRVISVSARIHGTGKYPFRINKTLSKEIKTIIHIPQILSKPEISKQRFSKILNTIIKHKTKYSYKEIEVEYHFHFEKRFVHIIIAPTIYDNKSAQPGAGADLAFG